MSPQITSTQPSLDSITITAPEQGAKWDFSGSNTITWTSVSTDPDSFEIVLVSPKNSSMAQSVIVDSSAHRKINFIGNSASNSGIITQSQSFAVTKSGVNATTSSASALGVKVVIAGPILAALSILI
ncbi:hypothetical protein VM1G_11475 [Cytospora mali]|uniref:Yeast cell wall synthesis Kre9/Knh1-like N-terminal domain-containing protein n=1 Tax=Cytospora mali TaxID=578113 RepID=A0A194VTH6_CYTMA|nr:hypothetical protein VM1G_11475 [Valsa mali]